MLLLSFAAAFLLLRFSAVVLILKFKQLVKMYKTKVSCFFNVFVLEICWKIFPPRRPACPQNAGVNEVTSRLLFLFIVIKFGTKVKKKRFKLAFNLNTSTFRFRTFCFFEYSAKFSQLLFQFSPIFFHFLKCKSGKSKADTFSLVLSPLEYCNSVAKSGILSRNLGILLSSWDVFGIFISKSQCRDFFGIFEKSIFLIK